MTHNSEQATDREKKLRNKMEMAIHGLNGIFWALNVVVVQRAVDDMLHDRDRENGIASLIMAGGLLTKEITGQL